MKYKRINREKVFSNQYIAVYEDDLLLPNGNKVTWTFTNPCLAVGIIAFTPEGKLLLVRQYRPAIEQFLVELPAGLVDRNENFEDAAKRELEEETGYQANKIKKIFDYYKNPGISSSKMMIYFAEDLVKTNQNLDENEILDIMKIGIDEIDEILKGPIDGKTLHALTYAKTNLIHKFKK